MTWAVSTIRGVFLAVYTGARRLLRAFDPYSAYDDHRDALRALAYGNLPERR